MKEFRRLLSFFVLILMVGSCGVEGDPGHCYVSIDWEYIRDDYAVTYYEDNNPAVPAAGEIIKGYYYDSYPGRYDYYYESEDPYYYYEYEGYYELIQNPGTPARLFSDGLDGAPYYFDLYLQVIAPVGKKAAPHPPDPGTVHTQEYRLKPFTFRVHSKLTGKRAKPNM